jgi:hypothetical protein
LLPLFRQLFRFLRTASALPQFPRRVPHHGENGSVNRGRYAALRRLLEF